MHFGILCAFFCTLKKKGKNNIAFDYKREYKEFYLPPKKQVLADIPEMNFIAVNEKGDPNIPDGEYKAAAHCHPPSSESSLTIHSRLFVLKISFYKFEENNRLVLPKHKLTQWFHAR